MSFSQHKAGADDGHWQSKYLGRNGVIRRDRESYLKARLWAFDRPKDYPSLIDGEAPRFVENYRDALLAYASTVYSARMFRPLWAPRELVRLVGEIEHLTVQIAFTASQKECLMAFQMYLSNHDSWWTGEVGRMAKAVALGREILADETAPLATRLLTMARMSKINDVLEDDERDGHRYQVLEGLATIIRDEKLLDLAQGWKTVCRLGMLIQAWGYVDLALKRDRSRDLRLKAYVQPGFVWYKLKKGIFGG